MKQKLIKKNKHSQLLEKKHGQQAITLIALVVTIVVLLILAGVSIVVLFGDNGIITSSNEAKKQTEIAEMKDRLELAKNQTILEGIGKLDVQKYFSVIKKQQIIKDITKDIIDKNDGTYEVTTQKGLVFTIKLEPNKEKVTNIQIEYLGEKGKLPPRIKNITITNKTETSFDIKVEVDRLEDGTLTYLYKEAGTEKYETIQKNTTDLMVTLTNIEEGKVYNIKVIVQNKKGSHEYTITEAIQQMVKSITLNETTYNMQKDDKIQLIATILPENAENKEVTWSSSNETVAIVDSKGLVTAKENGSAIITVKATDGSDIEESCEITVKKFVTELTLNRKEKTLETEKSLKLIATIQPQDATNQEIIWSSSNDKIATVSQNGEVVGVSNGTAVITATSSDDTSKFDTCTVVVTEESNWNLINKIAKEIANSSYTNEDTSATVTVDDDEYTINVGDIYKVKYNEEIKRVRVLGFNHDTLVDNKAYGGNNETAGISFEFYDFMLGGTDEDKIYLTGSYWGSSRDKFREPLNGTGDKIGGYADKLSIKECIKKVIKQYESGSTTQGKEDWLWYLSCSEIWSKPADSSSLVGFSKVKEGNRYAMYQKYVGDSIGSSHLVKRKDKNSQGAIWMLRSHVYNWTDFCGITASGGIYSTYNHPDTRGGVAPGFCI